MPLALVIEILVRMLWRRRWLIVVLVVALGGAATAVIVTTPPSYTAQSTILAKVGREHTLRSYGTGGELMPVSYSSEQIVGSAIQIMRADDVLGTVVDQIGPERLYPPQDEPDASDEPIDPRRTAILRLDDNLDVSQVGRSNVIAVELTHEDAELAAETLNSFVAAFRVKYAALYAENLVPVLETEVQNAAERAARAEEKVTAFESERLVFPDDTQLRSLFDQRIELEIQLVRLEECCAGSPANVELKADLAATNDKIVRLNSERSELRELTRERDLAADRLEQARLRLQDAQNNKTIEDGAGSSIQVISAAVPPIRTDGPGMMTKLALALILVSMFSAAIALVAEFLKRRYSVAAELAADRKVKVLAEIAYVRT